MIVTHNINLDLRSEYMLGIKIPQYTKDSHKLVVTVSDNGTPKTFNISNETAKFKANTPGEHYYYLDTTLTANNITITLPKEISAFAGRVQALFEISNSAENSIQATMKFYIIVTPSAYDEDAVVNSDIFTSLTQRLNQVDALITTANTKLASLNRSINEMNTLLTTTERNVTQKMAEVDTTVSNKMSSVDNTITAKMSSVDTTVSNKMDAVDTVVDNKLDSYDTAIADKIADVNTTLTDAETAVDNKLDEIDATATQRLSAFDTQVQNKLDNIDTLVQAKTAEMDALLAELDSTTTSLDWLNSTDKIIDSKIVDRGVNDNE